MKKSNRIKVLITLVTVLLTAVTSFAQGFKPLDKVPHDIAYYRETRVTKPLVKVLYGRPSNVNNEVIFGNKVPFGEFWRTGANEATEIKLYNDTMFGGTKVIAGTYVLYTVPGENEWEIILSSNHDVWGAFQYNPAHNVARIKVPVSKAENLKTFSIGFKKVKNNEILMVLAWGQTRVKVPLNFNKQVYYANVSNTKGSFKRRRIQM